MRRRPRSRIAHFQQPFLVGVVTSAALVQGCGDASPAPGQSRRAAPATEGNHPTGFAESDAAESSQAAPRESGAANPVSTDPAGTQLPEPPPVNGLPESAGSETCPAVTPNAGESCAGYTTGLECLAYCYEAEIPLVVCNPQGLWEALPVPTCNPPPPSFDCPAERPQAGVACTEAGAHCEYTGCEGGIDTAICSYGQWVVTLAPTLICNPPPVTPICPPTPPMDGSPCAYNDQSCDYGDCGGPYASCSDHTWSVYEVSCNPPEVEPPTEPPLEPTDAGAPLPSTDGGGSEDLGL